MSASLKGRGQGVEGKNKRKTARRRNYEKFRENYLLGKEAALHQRIGAFEGWLYKTKLDKGSPEGNLTVNISEGRRVVARNTSLKPWKGNWGGG